MTIDDFAKILPQAWTSRTDMKVTDLFVEDEPSVGQCAVTALVLQDYFGGEIMNTIVADPKHPGISASHYFNVINDKGIDLTKQQFQKSVNFSAPAAKTEGFASTREYMLSVPSTVERYNLLKQKVEELLR